MKRATLGVALILVLGLSLAGCASKKPTAVAGCSPLPLKQAGTLQVGAEFPYYPPFLDGNEGSPTGFEADIANDIAAKMGVTTVKWVTTPFAGLFAPGSTPFDFDINEITITADRDKVVDFSDPYFDANQGLLVIKGTPIESAQTLADLQQYQFGAQTDTTGLAYIQDTIKPTKEPQIFDDLSAAFEALGVGQLDAVVIDVPIAIGAVQNAQIPNSTVAAQFITNEQYGILFEEGNALRPCVNDAIAKLKADGTFKALDEKYFPGSTDLRTISS